jgi:UDP-glucose 4-epimerase
MRFAVIGGAGFVGSHLTKLLIKEKHDVIVIDNLHTGKKENLEEIIDKIGFYEVDIRNYEKLEMLLEGVDGIFHEAALTIVQESFTMKEEYYDVNVKGTKNVFKIAKKYGIKTVFASSSSVYGNQERIPILEDCELNPINPYGQTKLECELLAEEYSNEGVPIMGLRYFNIFGKGQTGSYAGVITKFMNNISKENNLTIYGDGKQIRDFIHVNDIAKANLVAMQSKIPNGIFNIGSGNPISINNLAKIMIELSNKKLNITYEKPLSGDIKKSLADTKKTEDVLSWKYEIELRDGLKKLLDEW